MVIYIRKKHPADYNYLNNNIRLWDIQSGVPNFAQADHITLRTRPELVEELLSLGLGRASPYERRGDVLRRARALRSRERVTVQLERYEIVAEDNHFVAAEKESEEREKNVSHPTLEENILNKSIFGFMR